ncbi:MAG: DUF2723 domain-containing protein [Planctomycetaceae bacterium]|nr:DUF2723 domain-containing protein [Planctomycetaceae bacterium]
MTSAAIPNAPPAAPRLGAGGWLGVLAAFCILYALTAQQAVSWQDSGEFQWRALNNDLAGTMGLARAHPLYIVAGHALSLISLRHFPWLLNAFSGLGGAVALANLAVLTTWLSRRRWIGLTVAAMLGVSHAFWWLSTAAEVYTWSVAGLTGELCLLIMLIHQPRAWVLIALAAVNGLGLCVHNFALLPLPVYLTVVIWLIAKGRLRAGWLLAAAAAWLAGAGLLIYLVIELTLRTGSVWGAVTSALVGDFSGKVLNLTDASKYLKANAALSALSLCNLLLPLAIVGWIRLRRHVGGAAAGAIWAISALHILFFVRYPVPDQFTFILPTMVMLAVAAAVGLAEVASWGVRWRAATISLCWLGVALDPLLYAIGPSLVPQKMVEAMRTNKLPRDEVRYWLTPWKQDERSAQEYARKTLSQAAPGTVLRPDSTSVYALLLIQRLEGLGPEVIIIPPPGTSSSPPS